MCCANEPTRRANLDDPMKSATPEMHIIRQAIQWSSAEQTRRTPYPAASTNSGSVVGAREQARLSQANLHLRSSNKLDLSPSALAVILIVLLLAVAHPLCRSIDAMTRPSSHCPKLHAYCSFTLLQVSHCDIVRYQPPVELLDCDAIFLSPYPD